MEELSRARFEPTKKREELLLKAFQDLEITCMTVDNFLQFISGRSGLWYLMDGYVVVLVCHTPTPVPALLAVPNRLEALRDHLVAMFPWSSKPKVKGLAINRFACEFFAVGCTCTPPPTQSRLGDARRD